MVGTAARAVAQRFDVPLVGVNHMVAHLEIGRHRSGFSAPVCLNASGANAHLLAYRNGRYRVLGDPSVWVYAGQVGTLVVRQGTDYRLRFDDGAELVFMPHQVERVPADKPAPKPSAEPKQEPPAEERTGDPEDREAKVDRLRELCGKRPDVALRLLAVALLQPLERIAVMPGLSARAVTVAGREGELSETIRSRLMAVAYRLPIGNTPVHELSPPGLYDDLSHLDDSEVMDILAELTVARLGPAEAPDSTGHSLLDTVLAIEEPAAKG
jgi:hypothetical protein